MSRPNSAQRSNQETSYQTKRNIRGEYVIWLDDQIVARLARLRDEGEDYSDVILRLAKAEGGVN